MSQYVHRIWTQEQGLFGGTIYAINRSSDGYLWAGTDRGLVRFDGYTFTLIQQPISNRPAIGRVRSLILDEEDVLWILLSSGRLLLYRNGQFEDAFASFNIADVAFSAMSLDRAGRVLVSGLSTAIWRWKDGKFSVIVKAHAVPSAATSIVESHDGGIWIGTENEGLFVAENGRVSRPTASLRDTKINALLAAPNGGVWVGTDQGIRFINAGGNLIDSLPVWTHRLQVHSLSWGENGCFWASTVEGLLRVKPGAVSLRREPSGADAINAVFEDREGSLWYGGSVGLERLQDGIFSNFSGDEGFPETPIGPIYADAGGAVWFAPLSGGLYWYWNGRLRKVMQDGLDRDVVYSIDGGNGEIWVGRQRGGLTRIVRSDGKLVTRTYTEKDGLAHNSVYTVHRSASGEVWAGTVSAGLSELGASGFKSFSSANGFGSDRVMSIAESRDGTIWMATSSGLLELHNGIWTRFSQKDGLPSAAVRLCFADSKGVLWFATEAGLSYLSGGRIKILRNLPDPMREQMLGITEDHLGALWFSMPDYVLRVNREALITDAVHAADVQSYAITDGLSEVEIVRRERSFVTDSGGRIWIALRRGVAMGDPNLTIRDSHPIEVRIDSVSANGKSVNLVDSTTIPAGTRSMTFQFGSDSLFAPERVRFRYRLGSSDPDWSEATESREATYHNLPPGNYQFQIMASRDGRFWNSPVTAETFSISPEYWETLWFRTAAALTLALFIVLVFRLRSATLSRQLNARFRERAAEREQIARDLHDTFFQSIQGLLLRFHTATCRLQAGHPARGMFEEALKQSDQVMAEGRELLTHLHATTSKPNDLSTALADYPAQMREGRNGDFRMIVNGSIRPLHPIIFEELSRIGKEALGNAFRHSMARSIEAELNYEQNQLRMRIRDDGTGIDPNILKEGCRDGHLGLPSMRERAKNIGAQLDLWSRTGVGTEIELRISANLAYASERPVGPRRFWQRRGPSGA